MKHLFTAFLIMNLLVEGLAASSLIPGPLGLSAPEPVTATRWAMNYGFGVIAIASAVFWVWSQRSSLAAVTPVLGILLVFHCSLFVALAIDDTQFAGRVIHGVMAALAVFLFTQRRKWCTHS